MDIINVLEAIQNPLAFDAFINDNMKTSTYKVMWDTEMDSEPEPSKSWTAATADYAAAMLGTVIDKNAEKPKRDMPSIGELSGTMARMGDEWQIDNDRLEKYYYMLDRLQSRANNLTDTQKMAQYKNLVKYLFNPFELASIAPHKRIWAQYLEGLSDGQITLTKTNNVGGVVWSIPLSTGIAKKNLRSTDVVWSTGTLETMDVLSVIQYAEDLADAAGKTVIKHRVSKATAALICQSKQLKDLLGLQFGKIKTNTTPALGVDLVNQYLSGSNHAPIEVINEKATLNDGTAVSLFKDGRVVSMCAPKVAILKYSDPLEAIDPVPEKVYTSFTNNLVSQWRNEKGRYVGYEMYAFPAFTGKNDVFILDVTQKEA